MVEFQKRFLQMKITLRSLGIDLLDTLWEIVLLIYYLCKIRLHILVSSKKRLVKDFQNQDDVEKMYPWNTMFVKCFFLTAWLDRYYEQYKCGLTHFVTRWNLGEKNTPLRRRKNMTTNLGWFRNPLY